MAQKSFWYWMLITIALLGGLALIAFCMDHWVYPTIVVVLGGFLVTMVYIVSR